MSVHLAQIRLFMDIKMLINADLHVKVFKINKVNPEEEYNKQLELMHIND